MCVQQQQQRQRQKAQRHNKDTYQIGKDEKVVDALQAGEQLRGQLVVGLGGARLHDQHDAVHVGKAVAWRAEVPARMDGSLGSLMVQRVVVDALALQIGRYSVVDVLLVVSGGLVVAQLVEGQRQQQSAADDDGGSPVAGRHLDKASPRPTPVRSHAWRVTTQL